MPPRLRLALKLLLTLAACGSRNVPVGSNRGDDAPAGTPPRTVRALCTPVAASASGITTALPPLPALTNLGACVTGDAVKLHFDPIDGAKDYRIYALPADADVLPGADGRLTVRNATYRCAGDRMAPAPTIDSVTGASSAVRTLVDNQEVDGYRRSLAEATLGYVYPTPGPDRVAVYALGDPAPNADGCHYARWNESRAKKYTTSAEERAQLLAARWRDDGVVFYVPASATAMGAKPLFTSSNRDGTRLYFVAGPEADQRQQGQAAVAMAFPILAQPAPGAVPLRRVHYQNVCGLSHDELAAGEERWRRAYRQGTQPAWDLRWSGLTGPTTLVVEALDAQCPYGGMLAPVTKPAYRNYPAWLTVDDARAASATGEVFINGQGEGGSPRPIARSFLTVSPSDPVGLDWFEGFQPSTPLAPFMDAPCGAPPSDGCWQQFRRISRDYDTNFLFVETDRNALAQVLGELWIGFADVASGVPGRFRISPNRQARIFSDSFLYVTLETNTLTTISRYPQVIISEGSAPVDWAFASARSLLVGSYPAGTRSWPNQLLVEVCDRRKWDVAHPCPKFRDLHELRDPADPKKVLNLAPSPEVAEHSGVDRATQWEIYASSRRIYLFLDGAPYGCADLPPGAPSGAVNVTFGHVLSGSGNNDLEGLGDFLTRHGQRESHRYLDNLGFASNVAAPPWNESLLPCATVAHLEQ